MHPRQVVALLTIVIALSLVAAPVTMSDWGEQATFSVEDGSQSDINRETPILKYTNLPADAQTAVRQAITSPNGQYTVYGYEDWPDEFFYSDYSVPGQGIYTIVYQGQYYRLDTYAGGGLEFLYWLYELPFISYGLLLGWVARRMIRGTTAPSEALLSTVPGVGFHLLGPEFDFPLLAPMQFIGLGAVATVTMLAFILISARRASTSRFFSE